MHCTIAETETYIDQKPSPAEKTRNECIASHRHPCLLSLTAWIGEIARNAFGGRSSKAACGEISRETGVETLCFFEVCSQALCWCRIRVTGETARSAIGWC
jgi:hypothetical protein